MSYVFGFFRVDGVRQLTHHDAAVYSARRFEMLEIVEKSLYYLIDRPVVHSELSGLPYMVTFNQFKLFCFFVILSIARFVITMVPIMKYSLAWYIRSFLFCF